MAEKDLKAILSKLQYTDDAKVVQQITEQTRQVQERMAGIKHKLVVMSGKGGVGKSMTTVNLALALARQGHRVGLLDVDLNGPCVPRMLGMHGQTLTITPEGTGGGGGKAREFLRREGNFSQGVRGRCDRP